MGMIQTVLVTGAAGFLGRHLVEGLTRSFGVRTLDPHPLSSGEHYQGSVTDRALLDRALEGVDAIVMAHMAPNKPGVYDEVALPFEVNVTGTTLLYEAAVRHGIRRVVLISSLSVIQAAEREGKYLSSAVPLMPVSLYSLTKALQEQIAQYYYRKHGIATAALRPAYICLDEGRLVDKYGRQPQTVNWLFIDPRDIATAAAAALRLPDLGFEPFVLVAGPDAGKHADVATVRNRLGWAPRYTFEDYPREP